MPVEISPLPSDDVEPVPAPSETATTATSSTSVSLADGVTLRAGPGQKLPVRVRWVQALSAPEQIAVDGDAVYAADYALFAFQLSTGTELWEAQDPSIDGLFADGGVEIGLTPRKQVRVWAPYNYDLTADRRTGRLIELKHRGMPTNPDGMAIFPAPRPTRFEVDVSQLSRIVARWPDGRVAWRIVVDEPMFGTGPAIAVPGGVVLLTSSGHLVVLDYV